MITRILIVEDEKPNADRLKRLIKVVRPQAQIITVLEGIADTIEWLAANPHPDVVMLDVRLSDGLSFEILERITIEIPVIFTTAYDEYAVKAFKYNSIDYLLKPVEEDELAAAFDKLERGATKNSHVALESLMNYFQPKEFRNRFLLPYKDGYKSLLVDEVTFFYSEHKVTHAKLASGAEELIPQTMEELEQQLNPRHFFRANRQFIIHIDAIAQVHNYFNGKLKVDVRNAPDLELIVSREKAHLFKTWLDF